MSHTEHRWVDSRTGRYVSEETAKAEPDFTFRQTVTVDDASDRPSPSPVPGVDPNEEMDGPGADCGDGE